MSSSKSPVIPVICVCDHQGVVGITSRKAYNLASAQYWHSVRYDGVCHLPFKSELHTGTLIKPSPVFVLGKFSPEHSLLTRRCFVERATFALPGSWDTSDSPKTFEAATHYLLGQRLRSADLLHELYFGTIPPDQSFRFKLRVGVHDDWMQALPSEVDTRSHGRVPTAHYFQTEWHNVHRDMVSPPSIENLIVTFFLESGCEIKELVVTDTDKIGMGTLELIGQHEKPWGKGLFRSTSRGTRLELPVGSTSGALLNKRFIFHKVVLTAPKY